MTEAFLWRWLRLMRGQRGTSSILLPFLTAVGLLIIYGPAFAPWKTFSGMDFLNLLYPDALVARRAFGEGSIPLWNWYQWGGSPLLAKLLPAVLYPPMWLTLPLPLPYGLQLNIFAHLIFAGVGAARLGERHFGVSRSCSHFAALAFTGSAFFFGRLEQVSPVAALAWMPWMWETALSAAKGRGGVTPFILATAMALLAGHPQYVVLTLLFLAIYCVLRLLFQSAREPGAPRAAVETGLWDRIRAARLARLLLALAPAGLLAAAQIFPTRELGALSERVWPYPDPFDPYLRAAHLPAFAWPRFFNHLADTSGRPLGYTETGLYAGLLTLPLFLLGSGTAFRRRCPSTLALFAAWALSLGYSLGSVKVWGMEVGLAPLVLRLVPFLAQSRGAARALGVETLCYAILATRGLSVVVSGTANIGRFRGGLPYALTALLAVDLAVTHSPELSSRLVDADLVTAPLPLAVRSQLRPPFPDPAPGPARLYRLMARDSDYYLDDRPSAVVQRRLRVQPNLNAQEQIPTTDGYEEGLLPTRSYANFLRRFNRNLRSETPDASLLALMGSNTMLTEYPVNGDSGQWEATGRPLPSPTGPLQQWRSAYPTAWLLDLETLEVAAESSSTQGGSGSAPGPGRYGDEAILHGEDAPQREPLGQTRRPHRYAHVPASGFQAAASRLPIRVSEVRANGLLLEGISTDSTVPSPRDILLMQAAYPGWKVAVGDGAWRASRTLPVRRLSPVFSAFIWPTSTGNDASRGELVFAPASFRLGLFVSLLTAALLLGGTATRRVKARTPRLHS